MFCCLSPGWFWIRKRNWTPWEHPQLSFQITVWVDFESQTHTKSPIWPSVGPIFWKTVKNVLQIHEIWWVKLVSPKQLKHVTWVYSKTISEGNHTLQRQKILKCVHPLHLILLLLRKVAFNTKKKEKPICESNQSYLKSNLLSMDELPSYTSGTGEINPSILSISSI